MIGHLGPRVSALLDGQLSPAEAERAWAHVHACHFCRDLVEREGWIKTQLAGLSHAHDATPDSLKGTLARGSILGTPAVARPTGRSLSGISLLGTTALGAAVAGVLALGVAQWGTPVERRPPVTSLSRPSSPASTQVSATSGTPVGPADLRLSTRRAQAGIAGVKIVR